MYARGKDHPLKEACARLIISIAEGNPISAMMPVIDTEVFQEVLYRYSAIGKLPVGLSICRNLVTIGIEILPVRSRETDLLIDLAEQHQNQSLPIRDLVHLSVMVANGINSIVTPDKHFDHFTEIKRLDPLEL
jgi:predicted nucleic acid-binding protein